jgi:hypothetical protein
VDELCHCASCHAAWWRWNARQSAHDPTAAEKTQIAPHVEKKTMGHPDRNAQFGMIAPAA